MNYVMYTRRFTGMFASYVSNTNRKTSFYVFKCMPKYMYASPFVCIHVCIHECAYVCVYICMYICVYILCEYVCKYIRMYVFMCVCMFVGT